MLPICRHVKTYKVDGVELRTLTIKITYDMVKASVEEALLADAPNDPYPDVKDSRACVTPFW